MLCDLEGMDDYWHWPSHEDLMDDMWYLDIDYKCKYQEDECGEKLKIEKIVEEFGEEIMEEDWAAVGPWECLPEGQ